MRLASRYEPLTSSKSDARVLEGQTMYMAGLAWAARMSRSNFRAYSTSSVRDSGSADGPCCNTTMSHRRLAIARRASPSFQWSSRLKFGFVTDATVIDTPAARAIC
jgi:hypothetical protein